MNFTMKQNKNIIIKLAVLLFWLGVWQGIYMIVKEEILIVSPVHVLVRIVQLVKEIEFWKTVGMSYLRITGGYITGVVSGVIFACLMSASKVMKELISPVLSLAKSVPVASFIILALVWIKKDYVPVFITFLIVLPIVCANVTEAIVSTDKVYLDVAKVYRFGFFKTIKTVYLHSVMPSFAASATTSMGLAWKSGVAAEVIAMPFFSIGYNLYRSKINIETVDLFAWTFVVVVLSVIVEKLIKKLLGRISGGKVW